MTALAAKSLNIAQWLELAEGVVFGYWTCEMCMYFFSHESWTGYLSDSGTYVDILSLLPFFLPYLFHDEKWLYYAYGNGGSNTGVSNNLPWYFVLPSLLVVCDTSVA